MPDLFSRLPSICTKVLGEPVAWLRDGDDPLNLRGIFEDPFAVADVFGDGSGVAGSRPQVSLMSADADPIPPGSLLSIRGKTWEVIGEPEADGMGMTVLKLHAA